MKQELKVWRFSKLVIEKIPFFCYNGAINWNFSMKRFFKKLVDVKGKRTGEKMKLSIEGDADVDGIRFSLRKKFIDLKKQSLKEHIVSQLASLKDEVNVEAILADLGEKYILRPDFENVALQTGYDQSPVLRLRYTQESAGSKEQIDRFVPLERYLV